MTGEGSRSSQKAGTCECVCVRGERERERAVKQKLDWLEIGEAFTVAGGFGEPIGGGRVCVFLLYKWGKLLPGIHPFSQPVSRNLRKLGIFIEYGDSVTGAYCCVMVSMCVCVCVCASDQSIIMITRFFDTNYHHMH
jgi:hypothetical protein